MTPELLEKLQRWAAAQMERPFDFDLVEDGKPYLLRWELEGSTPENHIYLHRIVDSELPSRLHGHPWPAVSIILDGRYIDHMEDRAFIRSTGDVVYRDPAAQHRMELNPGEMCVTLFLTGDKVEAWKDGRYAEIGDFA